MYNLHLSGEQLEIRVTVRDFVDSEIKPVVLKAAPPGQRRSQFATGIARQRWDCAH
jgi:hypothetical protein